MDEVFLENINSFKYEKEVICKAVSLDAKKGECIVLTGLSGCGKSTIIKLLNGLIPEVYPGELDGKIFVKNKEISAYKKGELAKYIGNVFQNINEQFLTDDVLDEVAIVGENFGLDRADLEKRANKAIEKMGLRNLLDKSIKSLSGGQKQKIAIASTLVFDNDIIIFDEPSSSLDYDSTNVLKEAILDLKQAGKTILIAEHKLYYLMDILDRLVIIQNGTIKSVYDKEELNEKIRAENDLRSFEEDNLVSTADDFGDLKLIEVNNLEIKNKDYKLDFKVDFELKNGEVMAIVGENGIGDSDIMMTDTINPLKSKFKGFHKTFKQDDLGLSLSSFLLN